MKKLILYLYLVISQLSLANTLEISQKSSRLSILLLLPLFIMIILLYKGLNMIITGFIGGFLAIIISYVFFNIWIDLEKIDTIFLTSVSKMLSFTGPIINSALAMAVFKAGGYTSALTLAKKIVRGKVELLAVFIILLQFVATYVSGLGGGAAMVIAPLAFSLVGIIPEVIAAMSIATVFSFTTSPASLETSVLSSISEVNAMVYSLKVQKIGILFLILASILAYYGAKKSKNISSKIDKKYNSMSNKSLFINTLPTIFLLFSVTIGPSINKSSGLLIFIPLVNMIIILFLISICTQFNINKASEALIEGSSYILTRLLGVGIFVTYINIIAETGAFNVIVKSVSNMPSSILLPSLIIVGFLIGTVSGAIVAAVLTLILPIAISFNLTILQLGLITMSVGLGAQICFVNMTIQALSTGFQTPILKIVKSNTKWILLCLFIVIILSLFT